MQRNSEARKKQPESAVESESEIEVRCIRNYGIAFIEQIKSAIPGWRHWSWADREGVLRSEAMRLSDVEI